MVSTLISAVFDTQEQAQSAVTDLRSAGIPDSAFSVIAKNGGKTTTTDGGGEITDDDHHNFLRGILGGGALGAGLGIAALAIPGVGPLVAAGAIAASAIPGAAAIGAAAGATLGTLNEALKTHGVGADDVDYYEESIGRGGVFVSVDPDAAGVDPEAARLILLDNGGHNAGVARASV